MSENRMKQRLIKLTEDRRVMIPRSINARMDPAVLECDEQTHTLLIAFPTAEWMSNPMGIIHGGILSTAADISMGTLCFYLAAENLCPTGSLSINYLRPGVIGPRLICRAHSDFFGRTVLHTSCEAWMENAPDKLVFTATGVFVNVRREVVDR